MPIVSYYNKDESHSASVETSMMVEKQKKYLGVKKNNFLENYFSLGKIENLGVIFCLGLKAVIFRSKIIIYESENKYLPIFL